MNKPARKIAVIGAGITGLTAAWSLQNRGCEVTLYERKDQPGGAIKSASRDGWLVEYGPNTFQVKSRRMLEYLKSVGLGDQITEAGSVAPARYIVRNGVLKEVPTDFMDLLTTSAFTTAGKLRVLKEPFIRRGEDPDESVSEFVARRLGSEILDYAVNPFVAGIYAGSPHQLAVRHAFPRLYNLEQNYGSLIQGAVVKAWNNRKEERFKTRLISFHDGLQVLPKKLASLIRDVRYSSDVSRVHRGRNGWEVIAKGMKSANFDHVLVNIPLYRFNEQLINGGGALLDVMSETGYPPLSVIQTGFRQDQVGHPLDGFGFLVPEVEKRKILGSLFSSTLFSNRAPEGFVLITTFVGGARQPELASAGSEQLKKIVTRELKDLLDVSGEPCFFDHIYWPHSIPHYTSGYEKVLEAVDQVESLNPGVFLAGNFRGGISMPDCIENGLEWAEALSKDQTASNNAS